MVVVMDQLQRWARYFVRQPGEQRSAIAGCSLANPPPEAHDLCMYVDGERRRPATRVRRHPCCIADQDDSFFQYLSRPNVTESMSGYQWSSVDIMTIDTLRKASR